MSCFLTNTWKKHDFFFSWHGRQITNSFPYFKQFYSWQSQLLTGVFVVAGSPKYFILTVSEVMLLFYQRTLTRLRFTSSCQTSDKKRPVIWKKSLQSKIKHRHIREKTIYISYNTSTNLFCKCLFENKSK